MPSKQADQPEVTPTGQVPTWHDAQICEGLWVCDYLGEETSIALFNDYEVKNFDCDEMKGCRWYGPIPDDRQ